MSAPAKDDDVYQQFLAATSTNLASLLAWIDENLAHPTKIEYLQGGCQRTRPTPLEMIRLVTER